MLPPKGSPTSGGRWIFEDEVVEGMEFITGKPSIEETVLGYRRLGGARSCGDLGRISIVSTLPVRLYPLKDAGGDRRKFASAKLRVSLKSDSLPGPALDASQN